MHFYLFLHTIFVAIGNIFCLRRVAYLVYNNNNNIDQNIEINTSSNFQRNLLYNLKEESYSDEEDELLAQIEECEDLAMVALDLAAVAVTGDNDSDDDDEDDIDVDDEDEEEETFYLVHDILH